MCAQLNKHERWASVRTDACTAQLAVDVHVHVHPHWPTTHAARFPSPPPSRAAKLQRLGTAGLESSVINIFTDFQHRVKRSNCHIDVKSIWSEYMILELSWWN